MSLLKDFVARGIYYNSTGIMDYATWSANMLEYFGPEIRPNMKDVRKWSIIMQHYPDSNEVMKLNCWQFMGCTQQKKRHLFRVGRELYKCPAFSEKRFDGIHGGINGGRACWMVSHTRCCDKVQGTYEDKHETCAACDFYRSVMEEEEEFMNLDELKQCFHDRYR